MQYAVETDKLTGRVVKVELTATSFSSELLLTALAKMAEMNDGAIIVLSPPKKRGGQEEGEEEECRSRVAYVCGDSLSFADVIYEEKGEGDDEDGDDDLEGGLVSTW